MSSLLCLTGVNDPNIVLIIVNMFILSTKLQHVQITVLFPLYSASFVQAGKDV